MANYASKVIDIALAEVNYHEKATNEQLDDKLSNPGSGNPSTGDPMGRALPFRKAR